MRVGLPAHGYVTFNSWDRNQVAGFVTASLINKGRLGNVLGKVSRPLGLVTENSRLGSWKNPLSANDPNQAKDPNVNASQGLANVDILIAALEGGPVIIEYYKVDESPILFARPGWARNDETAAPSLTQTQGQSLQVPFPAHLPPVQHSRPTKKGKRHRFPSSDKVSARKRLGGIR